MFRKVSSKPGKSCWRRPGIDGDAAVLPFCVFWDQVRREYVESTSFSYSLFNDQEGAPE